MPYEYNIWILNTGEESTQIFVIRETQLNLLGIISTCLSKYLKGLSKWISWGLRIHLIHWHIEVLANNKLKSISIHNLCWGEVVSKIKLNGSWGKTFKAVWPCVQTQSHLHTSRYTQRKDYSWEYYFLLTRSENNLIFNE